jgi:hypothetical protein
MISIIGQVSVEIDRISPCPEQFELTKKTSLVFNSFFEGRVGSTKYQIILTTPSRKGRVGEETKGCCWAMTLSSHNCEASSIQGKC